MDGIELSVFVLTDGKGGYVVLPEAKDYKRIGEGDTGLNTGGMGAVSPVPFADRITSYNVCYTKLLRESENDWKNCINEDFKINLITNCRSACSQLN